MLCVRDWQALCVETSRYGLEPLVELRRLSKSKADLSDLPARYGTNLIGRMPCLLVVTFEQVVGPMFFLIRCAFWLTIVFNAIFTTDQSPTAPSRQPVPQQQAQLIQQQRPATRTTGETGSSWSQSWLGALYQHLHSEAVASCTKTPADCAGIAARLTKFASEHPFDPQAKPANWAEIIPSALGGATAPVTPAPKADVPLPPVRPRHLRAAAPDGMKSAHARLTGEHFSRS
jgi:hypothetical protein